MLWSNSADSHFLEPDDLWHQILPPKLAERMPWSERASDDEEIIHVDGESFRRPIPRVLTKRDAEGNNIWELNTRPPGARDPSARIADLDGEGIWAEVVYSSIGLWSGRIKDHELIREAARAENEWLVSEVQGVAPDRLVAAALMPTLQVEDAVAELLHAAEVGLHLVSLSTGCPRATEDYNHDSWEPLWSAAEETRMVLGFHIGTDGAKQVTGFRGPGGAVLNYVDTTFGGQKVAMMLVASGALDRHPNLRVLISEGGASWVPFIGDRMNEGYRQHSAFVRPVLSALPKEILYRQVYTSFQHDESAPAANWAQGYRNVMFGSDYPHIEGTFGHTQETLQGLFNGLPDDVSHRIRIGAFHELFPHTSLPPSA